MHIKYRKDFCNPITIEQLKKKDQGDTPRQAKRLWSGESSFSYPDHCLFCGQVDVYHNKRKGYELIPVRTFDFQETVTAVCDSRADAWAEPVKHRIIYAQDLHAKDAVYHNICSVNFRTGKQIPQRFVADEAVPSKKPRQGRLVEDVLRREAFLERMTMRIMTTSRLPLTN